MGVAISELIPSEEISIEQLAGKVIAIDAHLFLYQFLSTIRQHDGTPLMDSKGNVTSHLSGLFQRTIKMLEIGIRPVYVFDGKSPDLKKQEQERRARIKEEASAKYDKAKEKEDIESMSKYAKRTSKLTPEMVAESKELLEAMGVPAIQAESEGEAQAAYLVSNGDAYAVASSDADALMFAPKRIIKNLAITGKRKKAGALAYDAIRPELIEPDKVFNSLGIDREQFIILCILVGTDYNPGGIKGIGPQKALAALKKYGKDYDKLFKEMKWEDFFGFSWKDVFHAIKGMPVSKDYSIEFNPVDSGKVVSILVDRHEFSRERIESQLKRLKKESEKASQKGLGDFF